MDQNLRVQGIKKEYEGQLLLRGISFDLAADETLCLLGSSGSGKSTLLRIIAGIETADQGQIFWNDEDITAVPTHLRHFGLMFQDYALFPHLNVADNIAFGLRMQNADPTEIRKRVQDSLEQVNLAGFEKRNVSELSGGEKQRVALARALAPSPRLLMLDEPLAALDRALRQQLQEELRSLLHQTHIPAIYVTHDQEEALALGDRLALLHEGQIVQMGAPEQVYRQPRNRWVAEFLGMENILPARVSASQLLRVVTDFAELAASAPADMELHEGDDVQIVLLPTGVTIAEDETGENLLPITVTESTFRGEHYQLKGKTNAGEELVFFTPTGAAIGTKLDLTFPRTNVVCLRS
ncbi:Spermidine/putrescine import ATP-binding protein PotA [bioreactor metagenome]|uniref:Spermidine/putrescine import ATP-binding protein PotA n=1 Tax=bioreactor metagenome TaxID=1076179 RepID=A0A645AWB5_9ZZZZ